jgi:diphthine-ammonia ligase
MVSRMGWAALTSGGKDSILSIQRAIDSDMEVDYLVTIRPRNPDSYMFHSSNLDAVPVIADASGIFYHEIRSEGKKEEELVELEAGIRDLPVEGIITGAVASEYQRQRIDRIAAKHAMKVFCPLWHMDPESLLREVAARLESIIVVTAADGLGPHLLGAHIDESLIKDLKMIASRYHIHLAGEGGEYESLTLNAPFYTRPITYKTSEIHIHADRSELVLGGFS